MIFVSAEYRQAQTLKKEKAQKKDSVNSMRDDKETEDEVEDTDQSKQNEGDLNP